MTEPLRAQGVRFNDLTMMFRGVSESLYRDACCHFFSSGYEQIARRIARDVASSW